MKVTRYLYWKRGLEAHMVMPADDTGGDVWTVAGVREVVACSGCAA